MKLHEAFEFATRYREAQEENILNYLLQNHFTVNDNSISFTAIPMKSQEELNDELEKIEISIVSNEAKNLILEKLKAEIQISILLLKFSLKVFSQNLTEQGTKETLDNITTNEEMYIEVNKFQKWLNEEQQNNT